MIMEVQQWTCGFCVWYNERLSWFELWDFDDAVYFVHDDIVYRFLY